MTMWDRFTLGNHRAVVRVARAADAVWAHIPWRRRDLRPEDKHIVVVDAATNLRVANVARLGVTRECGDLAFQPATVPGTYYVYFMPYVSTGRKNYPTVTYPPPEETADSAWTARNRLAQQNDASGEWRRLPPAEFLAIESVDAFNAFTPMENIATAAETASLLAGYPGASYLLFPEDRQHPIRMAGDIPQRWVAQDANGPFHGQAERGEFYAFQIGVFAARRPVVDPALDFDDLISSDGEHAIAASAFRCFNLAGVDWAGAEFGKRVAVEQGSIQALWCGVQVPEDAQPGEYGGTLVFTARDVEPTTIPFTLTVTPESAHAAGDDEPERLSRLRWLDSRIAIDDDVVAPFVPLRVDVDADGITVGALGRKVVVGAGGFPASIQSAFAPEMTHLADRWREVLAGPVALTVVSPGGEVMPWSHHGPRVVRTAPGAVDWRAASMAGALAMDVLARMEFDGAIEFTVRITAEQAVELGDIRLDLPLAADVARYMMGLGLKGGRRPVAHDWAWDVQRNQDSAWIGDVNAGLQFTLKDEHYSRPLNTNFYQLKPLVMPSSWWNEGRGGIQLRETDDRTVLVRCFSGPRAMRKGETLHFNLRLLLTPFKVLDTRGQWSSRYYHRYAPLDEIAAAGANTINVHHATPINPYINYPFLRPQEMEQYVDEAHQRGFRVKIYYTVRELTNRAPELFALWSLGDEVLTPGPGGGPAWLQEHLGTDHIAGWLVPELEDAAVINSGMSRWLNFYLEGLDWLARNADIDGLYIDDVAYDRTVMKRVRKILDRRRPDALIDLHSANQHNPRDGFSNSANLYLEHFPYLNRLWFGEYFDYNSSPDYWMVELSGIPFGLMGEMLQDGGNAWRGMLYGMTSRLPWAGDPRPVWGVWDEFGIQDSRMIGYWAPTCPVRTGRDDVLATVYAKPGSALVAVASWAAEPARIRLEIDWQALGIEPGQARLRAPLVRDFQEAVEFGPLDQILVPPGKGWLILIE